MFIAINLDLASKDSKISITRLLNEYGIPKINEYLYESFDFPTKQLGNLKRDMTQCLDMDDEIRLYQYPLDNALKISSYQEGKWKRISIKK